LLLLVAELGVVAAPALGAVDPWTSKGPWGGHTNALLLLDGGGVLAATSGGVFRTSDGTTWSESSNGLPRDPTVALARTAAGDQLVGLQNYGVYRSTNGGNDWSWVNTPGYGVFGIAADPTSSLTIHIAQSSSVASTTDGGATWASTPLPSSVYAILATGPGAVLAGTGESGIYRSTDSGATWTPCRTGLMNSSVRTFASDPATPAVVFAGTEGGLFRSSDGGGSWTRLTGLDAAQVSTVGVSGNTVWACYVLSLFRSTDGGTTWDWSGSGFTDTPSAFVRDAANGVVYAGGAQRAAFRSTNAGESWTLANVGIGVETPSAIAADLRSGVVHAGTNRLSRSTDAGQSWSDTGVGYSYDIASDGGSKLATSDQFGMVHRSTDRGATWSSFPYSNQLPYRLAFTLDGADLVAAPPSGNILQCSACATTGSTWTPFGSGIPATTNHHDVAVVAGAVLLGSSDGIREGTGGAFALTVASVPVMSIGLDARREAVAASLYGRVFRRSDDGTWSETASSVPFTTRAVAPHPFRPDTIYVATDMGVFRTTDGGASWGGFGLYNRWLYSIAIGNDGTTLFAGVINGGVRERSLTAPSGFYPLTPCRAVDTRLLGSPLVGATKRTFALAGACGVPADAKSVAVNLTVVNPAAGGDLDVFPGDEVAPLASAITFRGGRTRANNATLPVSQDGNASLDVKTTLPAGSADFLIDVVGFYR
jgi:photosystem II stability/assembly factor-like uncharacterized protein